MWDDTRGETDMDYAVQTSTKVLQRCVLMTTDPGDLAFDPTWLGYNCLRGRAMGPTVDYVRYMRVAMTLAKQRLMTAESDYYELAHPEEGVDSGLRYKTVPHVTMGSRQNSGRGSMAGSENSQPASRDPRFRRF
jgi:adenine-specific DNA-methyltransferase